MNEVSPLFFYLFAGSAVGFSLLVVLKRNPVASALSLIMVFFSFAGIYALLGAHLVAAMQILVYAGAIMVLFVFVIMLLHADTPSLDMDRASWPMKVAVAAFVGMLLAVFIWSFRNAPVPENLGRAHSLEAIAASGGNTRVLSELMFSEYLLPFELTSVLLLAAIVGAVAIAKRRPKGEGRAA